MNPTNNSKKAEAILAIGFTVLVLVLSWSEVVYIPISESRVLDLSIAPVMFAAMIGGYKIALPVALGWAAINYGSYRDIYEVHWIFLTRMIFALSTVFFYDFFKKKYQYSPWNVYRTIIVSIFAKSVIDAISMLLMFPHTSPSLWIKDSFAMFAIEMAICLLAMSLLIEKLREIHVLNGVKRKENEDENTSISYYKQNQPTKKEVI